MIILIKLFSNLYLTKFLDTSAKPFFSCTIELAITFLPQVFADIRYKILHIFIMNSENNLILHDLLV